MQVHYTWNYVVVSYTKCFHSDKQLKSHFPLFHQLSENEQKMVTENVYLGNTRLPNLIFPITSFSTTVKQCDCSFDRVNLPTFTNSNYFLFAISPVQCFNALYMSQKRGWKYVNRFPSNILLPSPGVNLGGARARPVLLEHRKQKEICSGSREKKLRQINYA